jgi:hypothetical protein
MTLFVRNITMISEVQADRLSRASRWCLLLALVCVAGIPCGCHVWDIYAPRRIGMEGLKTVAEMVLILFGGLTIASCFALASFICGVACAGHRKHVLFWTIPLWLGAGAGLGTGLFYLALFLNSKMQFIPSGGVDSFTAICAVWFGAATILSLASWLSGGVYRKRIKYFPWWSVPLWATVLLGVAALVI